MRRRLLVSASLKSRAGLAVSLPPLAASGEGQKSESTSGEAGSRRRLGVLSMALEQKHIDVLQEHLPYELNMLDQALLAWRIFPRPRDRAEWFAQMSAIEMFWVRARTLHEFFTRDYGPDSRTACANHFTAQPIDYDLG